MIIDNFGELKKLTLKALKDSINPDTAAIVVNANVLMELITIIEYYVDISKDDFSMNI
jgi:hypothetical protein